MEALDAERILHELSVNGVDYVLIGGLAVQTHGHNRTTMDADIIPAPSPANMERLAKALEALDAKALNPGHEGETVGAGMLPRATLWQFSTPHGGLDVAHDVPGSPGYEALRARAIVVHLGEIAVPVVGLDDLIRLKLAAGRDSDLADVVALTEELD